jgi:hypothetical protein
MLGGTMPKTLLPHRGAAMRSPIYSYAPRVRRLLLKYTPGGLVFARRKLLGGEAKATASSPNLKSKKKKKLKRNTLVSLPVISTDEEN